MGNSPVLRQLKALIASAAAGNDAVLLRAKPDCGAEAVARAIHAASARAERAFIAIDGSQFSGRTGILPSAAFGRGGKDASRLELAVGGTLFIDHFDRLGEQALNDLSTYCEAAKLARDAGRNPSPDVQLIVVTAVPESAAFAERIPFAVVDSLLTQQIRVPSVAEHRDDVPALANAILQRQGQALGRTFTGFDPESLKRLRAHTWPGNLRELEDVIVRSAGTAIGEQVLIDQLLLQGGTPLGSYRLLRKLGAGGFGEVWEARHQFLARPAAVKIMLGETGNDQELLERFRREATATASLASQNTVTLYDFGVSEQGQFYYVMELLDGIDLDKLAHKYGPPPPERLARFLLHACRSLAEAHARGLVHRDIKPANLFTCRLGLEVDVLKVLDFGLVRRSDARQARLTQDDMVIGTPEFMAPEIANGSAEIEGRTDIYSLAASAWTLCTGRELFPGDNAIKVLVAHIQQPPESLLRHAPHIPKALNDLIMAGLAKKPGDRPTAAELTRSLVATGLPQAWNERARRKWWDEFRPAPTS
ncbi:MAG TPA: protein kinase [Planctomycetota bacterium]|nr:protein kinase [Planctomycetota bacterium]